MEYPFLLLLYSLRVLIKNLAMVLLDEYNCSLVKWTCLLTSRMEISYQTAEIDFETHNRKLFALRIGFRNERFAIVEIACYLKVHLKWEFYTWLKMKTWLKTVLKDFFKLWLKSIYQSICYCMWVPITFKWFWVVDWIVSIDQETWMFQDNG